MVAIAILANGPTTALLVGSAFLLTALLPSSRRAWLHRGPGSASAETTFSSARGMLLLLPFSLLLFRQFDGLDGPRFQLYAPLYSLLGTRPIDVLILFIGFVALLARIGQGRAHASRMPKSILLSLGAFGCAIAISVLYGISKGGTNVFFDWREAFLGAVVAFVSLSFIRSARVALSVTYSLLFVLGARSLFLLIRLLLGSSPVREFGHSLPTFDGPTLRNCVSAALLALSLLVYVRRQPRSARALSIVTFLSSSLVVLVSMRRTYWGQLAIGLGILLMGVPARVRFRFGLIAASGALMAITMLEPNALIGRLNSLLIFSDVKNPYATTNEDHVNDLLDAWDAIMVNPLLGNGQGVTYQTKRIKAWKTTSSGVHNGPLHVWIQYGLLGLVSYALFHVYLFRWLRRQAREATDPSARGIAHGVFASWVGAFAVSLGFSPWPYGSLQSTMLLGISCGLVAAVSSARGTRRHRQDASGRAVMPTCLAGPDHAQPS